MAKSDPDGDSRLLRPGIGMSVLMDERLDPSNPLKALARKTPFSSAYSSQDLALPLIASTNTQSQLYHSPHWEEKALLQSIPAKHICRTWHCVLAGSVEMRVGVDLDVIFGGRSEAASSMGKIH